MATGRIGVTPTLRTRWSKAPAGGTTSLSGLDDNSVSLVYDVGYEAVYRNGVLLSRTNDYTATTGNSITLIDATIAGDIIEVFANQLLPLTNAIGNGQYTAKGALLSATAASTPAVLTVGSNDQVLTADSTTSTGLKWATPSAGGMTLISTTSLSGTTVTLSSIPQTYNNLYVLIQNFYSNTANRRMVIKPNGTSSLANYTYNSFTSSSSNFGYTAADLTTINVAESTDVTRNNFILNIYKYTDTVYGKVFDFFGSQQDSGLSFNAAGTFGTASAITSLQFTLNNTGNFDGGQVLLYGVK